MRKLLLVLLLALCSILLTGCYTEIDPWPQADSLVQPQVTAQPTTVPATAVPVTQPTATPEPVPEDAVDVSPNFNG